MRGLLITLGILMFIGGCIATIVAPVFGMVNNLGEFMESEQEQASEIAQVLCDEDEEGIQEMIQEPEPGGGMSFSLRYFCVERDGDRRDVTDEAITGLFTNPEQLASFLNLNPIFPAIALGGVLFFIFGLFYRPRREIPAVGTPIQLESMSSSRGSSARAPKVTVTTQTYDMRGGSSSFADLMKDVKSKAQGAEGEDFVARLQQLEDARSKNLITQEEYDRMRKAILDSMK
jgi:hypothetical protein